MASQTVSPNEAKIAQQLMRRLPPPRTLSRNDILATPDIRASGRSVRVYDPALRVVVILDADDPVFEV